MASRDGQPFFIDNRQGEFACEPLDRVNLTGTPSEDWLQRLLDQAPDLLPLGDVDDRIEPPLVSLGREVQTPAGPIDNLFISRNGYLVVVETKLWRNPEARRQVVAQLIDYAAHVRKWRYTDLERIARGVDPANGKSLWELVEPEDVDQHEWIDRVNENLARGRMCLLVVGDGIRSEVEALAEVVGRHPDFHFRLALVEIRLFRLRGGYLAVPASIVKTAEIERAVVRVEQGVISVTTPVEAVNQPRRSVLSEEALLDELRLQPDGDVAAQVARRLLQLLKPPLDVVWRSGSFTVKMPDPGGSGRMLSLSVVTGYGTLYAWVPWLEKQLAELGTAPELVRRVCDGQVALLRKYGAKVSPSGKQHDVKLATLVGHEERFIKDLSDLALLIEEVAALRT